MAAAGVLWTAVGSTRASRTRLSRRGTGSTPSAWWRGTWPGLDPADEPVGVERTVATRTDRIAVSGRIDRLDSRPAEGPAAEEAAVELVVVDYKTGRHLLTVDDARSSMALALYALAAGRALRRPCHRVELHHLPSGEVLAWSHSDESLARQLGRAEDIAAECADADEQRREGLPAQRYDEVFPPRPSTACGWCEYLRHCPEGAAAAVTRRPWDGLSPAGGLRPTEAVAPHGYAVPAPRPHPRPVSAAPHPRTG